MKKEGLKMPAGKIAVQLYYCKPERSNIDGTITTKDGIILQDAIKKNIDVLEFSSHPWVGRVIASGSDNVNAGDFVYLSIYLGETIEANPRSLDMIIYEKSELIVIPEVRILCIDNDLDIKRYTKFGI